MLQVSANKLLGINHVTSKCQMEFLEKKLAKNGLEPKKEYHHRILHIKNSLGADFQLKLTI